MFNIEDELHDEQHEGDFETFDGAVAELKRLAQLPWDRPPNLAPCTSWKTCGRKYVVVEFEPSAPRKELSRTSVLEVGRNGPRWLTGRAGSDYINDV
jgi:hypothetical protein